MPLFTEYPVDVPHQEPYCLSDIHFPENPSDTLCPNIPRSLIERGSRLVNILLAKQMNYISQHRTLTAFVQCPGITWKSLTRSGIESKSLCWVTYAWSVNKTPHFPIVSYMVPMCSYSFLCVCAFLHFPNFTTCSGFLYVPIF